jgi:signal transduction histidine kinase
MKTHMKFQKKNLLIWKCLFVLVIYYDSASTAVAQNSADSISTVVIDSAPKKLYSELYADKIGNTFMVEIYEEPQEGENLIHFRSFKNGKIIGRKSQAFADAHNFTFMINESNRRIMAEDTEDMLYKVLKKLMEESDQKLKSNLDDMFDQEKLAQSLSEKIKTPDDQIQTMAEKISKKITFDGGTLKNMAERISEQIKTPDEQIATMANEISKKITFDGGGISNMAERISKQIKTPEDQISNMASQISQQIKTPEARINEDSLALTLAIKLTQKENLVAVKIPPYAELLSQVTDSNQKQDYENTIAILDEDIADRTPEEQRKALKISGLMSVLVASKKLKRAISTIEDYDLPDDPALREISAALSEWVSKNLVVK